ncbi:ABC transporter ATP-binding protein [Streptomyces sp. DJ]|nr:ABC transporter ATP-binding protein [Streptomyces sp. DJ]
MGDYSGDNLVGHGVPELVVELNGQTWALDPSRSFALGRDPQSDLVFDDARVSWRHATISFNGRAWVLEDHGSTNGTYVRGQQVLQTEVGPGTDVRLGNPADGPRLAFGAPAGQAEAGNAHRGGIPAQAQATDRARTPEQAPAQAFRGGGEGHPGAHEAQDFRVPPQPDQYQHEQYQQQGQHQQQGQYEQYAQYEQQGGHRPQPQHAHRPQGVPPQAHGPGPAERPVQKGGGASSVHGAPPAHGGDRSPTTFHQLAVGRVMRIGRALENELVVSDLQVSRHHAEFHAHPDGRFEIVDLGSHNGTYVNGQPVQRHILGPDDIVGVGHSTFRLVGDRLEEFVDTGEVSFSARRLTVKVKQGGADKVILNDVSFGVPEKSLVAVIGPSGSGKSTLLRALTGYRPADHGEVLYDNRNLYKQFAELRQRIGLVPQDDILHAQLTVRTALRYAAKLRFPGDTAEAERNSRIEEVLRELKLDIHADKRITSLSGGQRKRVSVALELLTKPSLIFLDEPTSGLDPGMDRDVMQLLRGLADDGRTVLVVTHSVAELALCDRLLVMAPGGSVAYFGPPSEALNFFGYESWADVFQAFENYRDYDWSGRWRGSQHYQTYAADLENAPPQAAPEQVQPPRPPKPQSWGSQLWTLIRRYLSVIASDPGFIVLMFALPVVLGIVSMVIPTEYGLAAPPLRKFNSNAGVIILILAIGACFSGAANSVRELIKERVIYERERATGLSRSAYLMSKVIVLGVITALQGVVICALGFAIRELPARGLLLREYPAVEMTMGISMLGITSMMIGLIISALVRTAEKTMPLLVMFAIVQVVFTGVLFQIFDTPGLEQFAWLMPSRWGVAAVGATLDLGNVMPPWDRDNPTNVDPLWDATLGQWGFNMAVLLVMSVVCGFVVQRLLRRHEPEVMRER